MVLPHFLPGKTWFSHDFPSLPFFEKVTKIKEGSNQKSRESKKKREN